MSLKIIQLNIEWELHLDRIIPFILNENPDIVCMQEVREDTVERIKSETGMGAYYIRNKRFSGRERKKEQFYEGNMILSKHKFLSTEEFVYVRENKFEETNWRLLNVEIGKEGKKYRLMTTKYPWTPDGEISETQKNGWKKLKPYLNNYDDFLLCGDFNAPRGKEMFSMMSEFMTDNLPQNLETTLDDKHHRIKGLNLVVDTIFSRGKYRFKKIRTQDDLSDHLAIIAEID